MNAPVKWRVLAALVVFPALLSAQGTDQRARLQARGLPADLARRVAGLAERADASGLPGSAVADKAIEGWAKRVDQGRIVAAVEQYVARLGEAQRALRSAGVAAPASDVVVAAAEALGRGLGPAEVREVVRAAARPTAVAPGLTVAAALRAQGLGASAAAGAVVAAMRQGESVDQLLDLPSIARALKAEGMEPGEIGERMMRGGPPAGTRSGEVGDRPPGTPGGMPHPGQGRPPRPPGSE